MLKSILCLLLFAGGPQMDPIKKEMAALQSTVETTVSSAGVRVFWSPKATYLDGYGVVVSLEVMLEPPANPFSTPKTAEQVKAAVKQRRKDVKEKLSELLKQQVGKSTAVGETESLTVIVHLLPTTRADAPDQPTQLILSVKKDAPTQVNVKEF